MAAITTDSSSAIWWVGYEANCRWRDERCSLQPTLLSAPSCKAGVYARCWLKTVEMGDERPLIELWVLRGLLALRLICLCFFLLNYLLAYLQDTKLWWCVCVCVGSAYWRTAQWTAVNQRHNQSTNSAWWRLHFSHTEISVKQTWRTAFIVASASRPFTTVRPVSIAEHGKLFRQKNGHDKQFL